MSGMASMGWGCYAAQLMGLPATAADGATKLGSAVLTLQTVFELGYMNVPLRINHTRHACAGMQPYNAGTNATDRMSALMGTKLSSYQQPHNALHRTHQGTPRRSTCAGCQQAQTAQLPVDNPGYL